MSVLLINFKIDLSCFFYNEITFEQVSKKKIIMKTKTTPIKVAKLKSNSIDNGIIILISIVLISNLFISLEIFFN